MLLIVEFLRLNKGLFYSVRELQANILEEYGTYLHERFIKDKIKTINDLIGNVITEKIERRGDKRIPITLYSII